MLSDAKIRGTTKPGKMADGGGLTLVTLPTGTKVWWLRYRWRGKSQTLSLGRYPAVSLANAREARDEYKRVLASGRDPNVVKAERAAAGEEASKTTFKKIAHEWYETNRGKWRGAHITDVIKSLEKYVFPAIGEIPIGEITPQMCLKLIQKMEERAIYETTHRVHQRMSAVFEHGIALQKCNSDPAMMIKKLMKPKPAAKPQPAITDLKQLREMLIKVEQTPAHPVTKLAIRFLAITYVRPDTLHTTPWSEFDTMENAVWKIPSTRMKMSREFWITLPKQAIEIIEVMRGITGKGTYVFPNDRSSNKPMSENAIGYLLNRAGYAGIHCAHGFRASFNTIMSERYEADATIDKILDLMLAHAKETGPYNRASHLTQRAKLGQEYADMLLEGFPHASELLFGARR